MKEDEVLSKVFPKGAKHFQVSEKRGSKNIKELLAPSSVILSSEEHLEKDQQRNLVHIVHIVYFMYCICIYMYIYILYTKFTPYKLEENQH